MTNLTLRSLRPVDLDRVTEIENELTGRSRRAFQETRLVTASSMPESFITCAAEDRDKLVGYGFARVLHGEFGVKSLVGMLVDIGVDPSYQGKGIGKQVLSGIEQRLAKKGVKTLQTQANWSDGGVIPFFSAAGFVLGPDQIIERDTSPLGEGGGAPAALPGGEWRVRPESGADRVAGSGRAPVVRPLREDDLASVVGIDTKLTGLNRFAYYMGNFREMLNEVGARVSLVAEQDGQVAGFVMARIDYGEYGRLAKAAVIDAIGVNPAFAGSGVGHLLLSRLIADLASLRVEKLRTKVGYRNFGLRSFLQNRGFAGSQRLLLTKEIG